MYLIASGPVQTYSLDAIFEATESSIPIVSKTQHDFEVYYETSFVVIDDGDIILGISTNKDKKTLIMEKIDGTHSQEFGERDWDIETLLYHDKSRTLFVGASDEKVVQYKRNQETGDWEVLKDFGKLMIDSVRSCTQIGNLVIFGGLNRVLRVIHVSTGEVVGDCVETAIGCITSLQACVGLNGQVYLSVAGSKSSEASGVSDLLDITLLCEKFK